MQKPVPSTDQCLHYIEQYQMLDNIRAHSYLVARVAEVLLDQLHKSKRTSGTLPDKNTVIAGALLHDIAKTECIKTNCHHAKVGQRICEDLGHPEIGEIVAEHVVLSSFRQDLYEDGIFGAKELVFYSDKRVNHDQVVSLPERLEYIIARYGKGDSTKEHHIRLNFNRTIEFEKYLFKYLNFNPSQLSQQISKNKFYTAATR
ncbi:MAG: HDIG domain-containing protein [Desulfobulbaceae bacterium]|nr:HDIG domain-containing protein [Desulfobulbaceae bacterium]